MIELTPGAQWAIERLDGLASRLTEAGHPIAHATIQSVVSSLRGGETLNDLLYDDDGSRVWSVIRDILRAALVRDALAPLESRIAELESRNASMRTELDGLQSGIGMLSRATNDLDERTFGMARIGGRR